MKRILFAVVVVAGSFGLITGAGAGSRAAAPLVPAPPPPPPTDFAYSPTSGPAGTVITASGNCDDLGFPAAAQSADDAAGFAGETGMVTLELSDNGTNLAQTTVDMNMDRSWEAMLTVPANTPAGEYDLDATCQIMFEQDESGRSQGSPDDAFGAFVMEVEYNTQIFTVTAQPATTAGPTSTAGPTTTAPAVAAQAVRTQPSFTG